MAFTNSITKVIWSSIKALKRNGTLHTWCQEVETKIDAGGEWAGGTVAADVTLDDGSGASPSLIFKDATDETATLTKADSGFLSLTTEAGDGLNILVGNLKVGNGTPDVTLNGEDAYIEGTLEVDGAARFDGAAAFNGAITCTSTISGDGGDAFKGFLKLVEAHTSGDTLTAAESGTVHTNYGAGGAVALTLPSAAAGMEFTFVVMAAQQLRVTPATGDVVYINAAAGSAAEYWWADAVGESVHLVAVDATNWVAVSHIGTWTQESP